ncbi:MAG TPA: methyltransferase domain-containing protein [Acidimicrobiales bacterium]|nr:methyltransferase domain-containing protein [Acidimicrobiales bacterium]
MPRRVPIARLRIHNAIVDRLGLSGGDVLLDVGCGNGLTMATAATRVPGLVLLGHDLDGEALAEAASWLAEIGARHQLVRADLDSPLPLADGSVTHVVCHDVLECLAQPLGLVAEAARVLRAGGVAVWSHVDYDSVVIAGADRSRTRRMAHAYADLPRDGIRTDPQMGRNLAGLLAKGPLVRTGADASVLVATELAGPAGHRIEDMVSALRRGARAGRSAVDEEDVERWRAELVAADERGEFFYAQTAYLVTAVKPPV